MHGLLTAFSVEHFAADSSFCITEPRGLHIQVPFTFMQTVNWVDPNSYRVTNEPTGTIRVEDFGIEVNIELVSPGSFPTDVLQYIDRALALLNSVRARLVQEPESEPQTRNDEPEQ